MTSFTIGQVTFVRIDFTHVIVHSGIRIEFFSLFNYKTYFFFIFCLNDNIFFSSFMEYSYILEDNILFKVKYILEYFQQHRGKLIPMNTIFERIAN